MKAKSLHPLVPLSLCLLPKVKQPGSCGVQIRVQVELTPKLLLLTAVLGVLTEYISKAILPYQSAEVLRDLPLEITSVVETV